MTGDPTFDTYYASTIQFSSDSTHQELLMRNAGTSMLGKIGASVFITHSTEGVYGWS